MKLTKEQWIAIVVVGIIVIVITLGMLPGFTIPGENESIESMTTTNNNSEIGRQDESPQVQTTDVTPGAGREAKAGDTVTVHYTGRFENGQVFDSSVNRGEPIEFVLGQGYVIAGWDAGLQGMRVGGKRELVIPPELGYGPADYGPIPGNSTLYFTVELLRIQ